MKILKNSLGILTVVLLSLSLTSCGSSSTKNTDGTPDASNEAKESSDDQNMGGTGSGAIEKFGDSDSGKAGHLSTVYFAFNSAVLSDQTRQALSANAGFLQSNDAVEVQVEGHCDERGGIQYNIALGEKRAQAVRDFLVASGVSSGRITTISYGKERPVAFGHGENAWSKNRRGNFVITAK